MTGMFGLGFDILESEHMVDGPFEDWSRVRSPGRARRRRWKHPQRIRIFYTPKPDLLRFVDPMTGARKVVGHPSVVAKLRKALSEGEPR